MQGDLVHDVVVDLGGYADASGLGHRLQACRDVDSVAVDARLVMDHVAEVYADAQLHAPVLGHILVVRGHDRLNLHCAFDGGNDARKLGKNSIARGVDDPAAKFAHQGKDSRLMALEGTYGRRLVFAHQPGVAGNVRCQDCGESPRNFLFRHPIFPRRRQTASILFANPIGKRLGFEMRFALRMQMRTSEAVNGETD